MLVEPSTAPYVPEVGRAEYTREAPVPRPEEREFEKDGERETPLQRDGIPLQKDASYSPAPTPQRWHSDLETIADQNRNLANRVRDLERLLSVIETRLQDAHPEGIRAQVAAPDDLQPIRTDVAGSTSNIVPVQSVTLTSASGPSASEPERLAGVVLLPSIEESPRRLVVESVAKRLPPDTEHEITPADKELQTNDGTDLVKPLPPIRFRR